jgi:peptide/nickel transport system substrate-binding protein
MQTADPDVFFDIEGLAVMLSVYEGLLEYAPDSTELVGNLAESWDVSADQKTYTFKLREGLTFADGSPLDSTAMKASFERRSSVNQAPGYMVAGVESYETPDPLTLVVNLAAPDVSFLHLMASAWSPKATNPAVLEKEGPDDFAQAFLESNSAGSGPYVLERFDRGVGYALVRNENYWGEPPYFARVEISVSPDISTQLLALERGDLDAILHGFPLANLENARGNSDLKIHLFESLGTTTLFLNTFRPALADTDAREAMMLAIDIPELVQEVYGDTAQTPDNAYPPGLLDPALAPVNYEGDPDVSAIEPGTEISIVYTPDSSGVQRRLADLMRLRLAEVGVVANPRQVQLSEVFGYRENVADAAEIYISTPTPDGAHPDTWARLCWYTEGPLNFFNYSNADLDAAVNRGISETNEEASMQAYGEAGRLATADWAVVPFAYVNDVVVARGDLGNLNHIPAYPWTIDLGSLTRGG